MAVGVYTSNLGPVQFPNNSINPYREHYYSSTDSFVAISAPGYLNGFLDPLNLSFINNGDSVKISYGSNVGSFIAVVAANGQITLQGDNLLQRAQVSISAAQFNGMYAAPVQLVAAPGANSMIIVESMQLVLTFGSAAFAAGGVVAAQYDSTVNGAGVLATNSEQAADFFAAASGVFNFISSAGNGLNFPNSTCANKGIYLSNQTQAFTTGTGSSWKAKVFYRVISTNS